MPHRSRPDMLLSRFQCSSYTFTVLSSRPPVLHARPSRTLYSGDRCYGPYGPYRSCNRVLYGPYDPYRSCNWVKNRPYGPYIYIYIYIYKIYIYIGIITASKMDRTIHTSCTGTVTGFMMNRTVQLLILSPEIISNSGPYGPYVSNTLKRYIYIYIWSR